MCAYLLQITVMCVLIIQISVLVPVNIQELKATRPCSYSNATSSAISFKYLTHRVPFLLRRYRHSLFKERIGHQEEKDTG